MKPDTRSGTKLLSKVPEVTLYFWIIKILATTVGETAADYLNVDLGFGLKATTLVTAALLAITLVAQFSVTRYIPALYWWTVLLISVTSTFNASHSAPAPATVAITARARTAPESRT